MKHPNLSRPLTGGGSPTDRDLRLEDHRQASALLAECLENARDLDRSATYSLDYFAKGPNAGLYVVEVSTRGASGKSASRSPTKAARAAIEDFTDEFERMRSHRAGTYRELYGSPDEDPDDLPFR